MAVRNAVRRGQVEKFRPPRKAHIGEKGAVFQHPRAALGVGFFGDIRRIEGRHRMHRNHHRQPVDGERLVVGRTRPAAAAVGARARVDQSQAAGLKIGDDRTGLHR